MSVREPHDRPLGKGVCRTAQMHVSEESDSGVILMNQSNNDGRPSAESEEGRPLIKANIRQASTHSTQSEARVSQGLAGVRKAAMETKEKKFTTLLHHLTVGLLREGFFALKRKAALGIDGVTWQSTKPV
jgi:RNA-directed DNA polymerase